MKNENSNSQKPKEGSSDNIKGGIRKVGQVPIGNPSSSVRGIPGNEKEDIDRIEIIIRNYDSE